MKSLSIKDKYRFVRTFGRISRKRINYTFTAFPDKDLSIIHAENKSRWKLVNEVYELLKELN